MTAIEGRLLTQQSPYLAALRAPDRLLKRVCSWIREAKSWRDVNWFSFGMHTHLALNKYIKSSLQLAGDGALLKDYDRSFF